MAGPWRHCARSGAPGPKQLAARLGWRHDAGTKDRLHLVPVPAIERGLRVGHDLEKVGMVAAAHRDEHVALLRIVLQPVRFLGVPAAAHHVVVVGFSWPETFL